MKILINLFRSEYDHFQRLSKYAQKLIISIIIYTITNPLFGIFLNAFLWRRTQNMVFIALYNMMFYAGILVGFYINGKLLRKNASPKLYTLGMLLMGISVAVLTFLQVINLPIIIIFGFLYGISGGIYWANRNLLTLKTTQSDNRIYFSSLESTSGTISDIVIPFLIGIYIVYGSNIHFYTPDQAYQSLSIVILLSVVAIWFFVSDMQNIFAPVTQLFLKNPSSAWKNFRLFEFILGFITGLNAFITALMVLILVGKENTLGTFQSLAAVITALVVYTLGKKLDIKHRLTILQLSFLSGIAGAIIFSLTYSPIGVFLFFVMEAISLPFQWIAVNSLNYDLIDKENRTDKTVYAYIFDQDIYLCAGRIFAIIIFILIIQLFSNSIALRYTPLLLALSQILLFPVAKLIENKLSK